MSLPKTIQWCETHGASVAPGYERHYSAEACRLVALCVAGPDDLVIRREKIDYEAAAELVAFRIGSVLQDGHEKEGACVMCRKDARDIIDAALVGKREAKENLRAAVVPLLRLEAAQRLLEDEYRRYRLGWNPLPFDDLARQVVYAALGLGEES